MRIGLRALLIVRLVLTSLTALVPASAAVAADVAAERRDYYVGIFGGIGSLGETSMRQVGTVIMRHPVPDIDVDASGSSASSKAAIAGVQLGWEFNEWRSAGSAWSIGTAAEIEGLDLGAEPEGVLDIEPQALGTQYVTLPINSLSVLVNAVFTLRTPYSDTFLPYAGAGAGYGVVFVDGSNSTNPSEPGINHFNAEPDAFGGGLALQAKIGVRAKVSSNLAIFTEFRHVSISPTDYTFGETDYPGDHPPTTKWNIDLGQQNYNLWVTGVNWQY